MLPDTGPGERLAQAGRSSVTVSEGSHTMNLLRRACILLVPGLDLLHCVRARGKDKAVKPWVVSEGTEGPGKGKHIVLVSGDEEYRSEEALPQLAKILAKHHGFKCTVLFAINPDDGTIDPKNTHNIPGLEALDHADLMVIFTRFRDLPDEQM